MSGMPSDVDYLSKPWLKSYKLGPYRLDSSLTPYPQQPLYAILEGAAEKYPGQSALLYLGRSLRYTQLKSLSDRMAGALVSLGVRKGDRVCLYLPNCPEFIISDWAVLKTGASVVPTSVLRSDEGLLHEVGSSGSKVVICREESLERVLAVRERADVEHILVTSTEGYDVAEVTGSLPAGVSAFGKLLARSDPIAQYAEINPSEDLCELAFTGGATGIPKGVMITHANRTAAILQMLPWVLKPMLRGFAGKSSVMIPVPLFHAYGHYAMQAAASLGLRVILLPDPRDIDLIVAHMMEYRPFMILGVPTQFMRIAQESLGRLNTLLMSGSAPLPYEIAQEIKKKTGMPVSEGYGLTETSTLTHFNVSAFARITGFMAQEKPGIGMPTPDTECMLVDPETGQHVGIGEPGEILVRGPQLMKGYWPEPGSGLTKDGWLHTGDIAVMDEDGYFQVVDRTKDMVNVSGMKVYTTKIDEVLFRHPGVLMAAAFGVPDPEIPGSERVMAVLQLKPGYTDKVVEVEIRDLCRESLAPYEVPKYIEFRDELPLTVTEKVFKKVLREEVIAKMKEVGS